MKLRVSSSVGIGKEQEIEVDPMDLIERVVEMVATVQAMEPTAIGLAFEGNLLPLERTVKNCGLKDGDRLLAMPRNPVGGSSGFLSNITEARLDNERARLRDRGVPLWQIDAVSKPLSWRGRLPGRGRWSHQVFDVEFLLHPTYPARPPRVRFLNLPDPPHPNISSGGVCLNHLGPDWSPTMTLESVYRDLEFLLTNPNFRDPIPRPFPDRMGELRRLLQQRP